ncbi:MAG: helix-turn-helix transcriptional regulator [Sporomusaceae bacterium]|nr:helix-turn-helix transcriptional regulator [Sporomusaceae bacterium]
MAVHDNVERIREARGVTKTYIASKIGLSLQGYRHKASGNCKMDVEELKILAFALCVDVSIFFDDELTDSVIKKISNIGNRQVGKTG